ncbi:hypothetical protein [Nocardia sp. NBC_01388]|uniref:deoxynucleotide monophosphate kinase family protein n=1 Tax=Nocardia sp. NBC_01388 TaxID=2903596 RepID=UPI003255753A
MGSIALVGHARAGKDSIAQYLVTQHGYTRVAMADPIKDALLVLNPLVATPDGAVRIADLVTERGWEGAKSASPDIRRLMQALGTDVARTLFGDDVWIALALRTVGPLLDAGLPVVISDVRFPNEASAFRRIGLRLVKVTRPGFALDTTHESETSYSGIDCDAELINATTLDDLYRRADQILTDHSHGGPARGRRTGGRQR